MSTSAARQLWYDAKRLPPHRSQLDLVVRDRAGASPRSGAPGRERLRVSVGVTLWLRGRGPFPPVSGMGIGEPRWRENVCS